MKIGIEVQRLFRKQKYGIETSAIELIKNLAAIGPDNNFIIFAKNDEDRACLTSEGNIKIKIVSGNYFVDFEQFFLPLAARNERVDVLHCTGNTAPYFSTVPVVQTLHDVIFMDAIPEKDTFYQRFGNHYRRKIVPLVTPRSEVVITVSEYEKQRIISRLGIDEHKVHVVYNGINEKRFYPHPYARYDAVRQKYNLPPDFILFLGNASFRKNSGRVIESYIKYAAESLNPLPLVTPSLSEKYVTDKLKELSVSYDKQKFITPGYIADEDLPLVYALSTIFLFPSLSEGFGMPVVEAMACGTPVITSKISSMPEIAGNAAILIDPLSTRSITDALISLTSNEALRNKKIKDGLLNAKRFNWATSAEKILSLYENVYKLAKKPVAGPAFLQKQVSITRELRKS